MRERPYPAVMHVCRLGTRGHRKAPGHAFAGRGCDQARRLPGGRRAIRAASAAVAKMTGGPGTATPARSSCRQFGRHPRGASAAMVRRGTSRHSQGLENLQNASCRHHSVCNLPDADRLFITRTFLQTGRSAEQFSVKLTPHRLLLRARLLPQRSPCVPRPVQLCHPLGRHVSTTHLATGDHACRSRRARLPAPLARFAACARQARAAPWPQLTVGVRAGE